MAASPLHYPCCDTLPPANRTARPCWPWWMAFPPACQLDAELIDAELPRRQGGYGRGGRQQIETDHVDVLSGIWRGITLGSPIALLVPNKDYKIDADGRSARPRPGHGDLSGSIKYLTSVRAILERASAGRRPPAWPPAPWPSNCSPRWASRPSATWSKSGRWRIEPQAGHARQSNGPCASGASSIRSIRTRTSEVKELIDQLPARPATRWAASSRSASRACPTGWARTPNGTGSSTAGWPRR